MALKVADLGHNTSPLDINIKWVKVLEEEMFRQGDQEKARHLPVSPLCDRDKNGVTCAQVNFWLKNYCLTKLLLVA
jgi:hypothetical protein